MKETHDIMGMPVTVCIQEDGLQFEQAAESVFLYFHYVDQAFSTYKDSSEISKINRGEILPADFSKDMKKILHLAAETKQQTNGYFDILQPNGLLDPSGIVKGWAIYEASKLLHSKGCQEFFVDAGGDIQYSVPTGSQKIWRNGIRSPFNLDEIVQVLGIQNQGVATSGTYIRGQHIYNPHKPSEKFYDMVSLTVVGSNIYEADRFATAAFAMGTQGIQFIQQLEGFEGYMIDKNGITTKTSGWEKLIIK